MPPPTLLWDKLHSLPSFLIPSCYIALTLRCSLVCLLCRVKISYPFSLSVWTFSYHKSQLLLPLPSFLWFHSEPLSIRLKHHCFVHSPELLLQNGSYRRTTNTCPAELLHTRSQQLAMNSLTQPFLHSLARGISQPSASQALSQEQVLLPSTVCRQKLLKKNLFQNLFKKKIPKM